MGVLMKTYAYGFPRLGQNREYKRIIENYWKKNIGEEEMLHRIQSLDEERLAKYETYVDLFPVGEMTLYCNMLDTAIMIGLYTKGDYKDYFELCRGKKALKLTKWFNTNYHYLVPDFRGFSPNDFKLCWNKPREELERHKKGIPYLIGPFTFLKLSTGIPKEKFGDYLLAISDVYKEIVEEFSKVHIDEPAFVLDISQEEVKIIKEAYKNIGGRLYLFTYYEAVDFLKEIYNLPLLGIGLDFVAGKENLRYIEKHGFPSDKELIAGVVNGRNVWRTVQRDVKELIEHLYKFTDKVIISNSSPLYHLPVTIKGEDMKEELLKRLAFAEERLSELRLIAEKSFSEEFGIDNFGIDEEVRERVRSLTEENFERDKPYHIRREVQKKFLSLPLFPTTTIGSFPQTNEIRKKRRDFEKGRIKKEEYDSFIKEKIKDLIEFEEKSGLDVLVHGEFERSDMVEFFAKKLQGVATTKNGWIISYGTRAYRPPIIYGDIKRKEPMTVKEISYAQSLTQKPVKAILTGPVTIIAWSFTREDIPVKEVAYQIALSLYNEVCDLEKKGIRIIQIDEPAFRERAPIKKRNWDRYFEWAIKSFRLASRAKPETQIHTHMCYSKFAEIIDKILMMDFDVISIEASRNRGALIGCFKDKCFDRGIGPGIWDVHSPLVPSVCDMKRVVEKAMEFIPKKSLWINPDCGLKTRDWKEVVPAIGNMVKAAKEIRDELKFLSTDR